MFRTTVVTGAVAVILAGGFATRAEASVTIQNLQQAYAIAQQQVPGGQLVVARVESKGTGSSVMGFYFFRKGGVVEIEISATGQVVKKKDATDPADVKDISPDVLKLLQKAGRAKLPTGRLLEIASAYLKDLQVPGGMAYKVDDGKLVVQIGSLVLDAQTGQVIKK